MHLRGIITKGIGSFYYVEADGEIYECKARGIFRKNGIMPLPGDRVEIEAGSDIKENTIDAISDRKNFLKRPPVANIDRLFIVTSVCEPNPSTLIIDRLTAIAEQKEIEPLIVITKCDLDDPSQLRGIYEKTGIRTFCISKDSEESVEEIRDALRGRISAFTGNTGVGKSTLLNRIAPGLSVETGDISKKLGRGRHTTRHVELYPVCDGYVADTPGFSALDIEAGEFIHKDDLQFCFREFLPHLGKCRFSSCAHVNDKGCSVIEAVENEEISRSRHESYVSLYNEAKEIKDWELR